MSRRNRAQVRQVAADPIYNSVIVSKLVNQVMQEGKKSKAEAICYQALERASQELGRPGLEVFQQAIDNIKPALEVKSRRVGGATYQVPVEVRPQRQVALALRWMIAAARNRSGHTMFEKLSSEVIDAYNQTGAAVRKKEEMHRMAEGNKAFAHFRW